MALFKQPTTLRSVCLWLLAMLIAAMSFYTSVRAEVPVPPLTNYVVDTTGTLSSAQQSELNQGIAQLEEEKGSQIMVLMVPTVQPDDTVETYARRVFDEWRIGRAKIDDGVLVLVAKNDRRMRIETGYGLEGAITDVQASYIINRDMAPAFQANDYYGGLKKAVDHLTLLIQGEDLPGVSTSTTMDEESLFGDILPMELLLFMGVFVLFWPIWLAPIVAGFFILAISGSIGLALIAAVVALIWNLLVKKLMAPGLDAANSNPITGSRKTRRKRNHDHWGGFGGGGGFGGFGGGGFGGGGFGGGGGGSSGGGGASGGW